MFSDQAEKLLDVGDILNGQYSIFFPRNTGREFVQMYLTASIASWLKLGLTFLSLKLGTALLGLFTLPFIYLLGKEVANRYVGLAALLLAGIAYWPNVISRIGSAISPLPVFCRSGDIFPDPGNAQTRPQLDPAFRAGGWFRGARIQPCEVHSRS